MNTERSMTFSAKFIRKYMRLAREIGTDQNPCHARQIGAVIVRGSRVLGIGYNGPPSGTPHCDSYEYLECVVWPQLTDVDKDRLRQHLSPLAAGDLLKYHFCDKYADTKQCPRRVLGIASGERTNICSCLHAEQNAILNSSEDLTGSGIFIWGPGPCWNICTPMIVQKKIAEVHCLNEDYAPVVSEWLLRMAHVELWRHNPANFD